MATEIPETIVPRHTANRMFLRVEHSLYLALGILLVVTSVLALAGAAATLWNGLGEWSSTETVFTVIDRLLFVLMLIEILHTVRASVEFRFVELRTVPGGGPDCVDPAHSGHHA